MIQIKVKNKELYIPEETAITLEQQNYALADENVAADIVWSFDIPAAKNMWRLGTAQFMYTNGTRRYDCELAVDGVVFSRGQLYVQSAKDEKVLTCGVVCNAFGIGFGSKKLNEMEYATNITISDSAENHKSGWRSFLAASLNSESVYKFFLFLSEKFYQDNEEFGLYNGHRSPLQNTYDDENKKLAVGWVNRLFFDAEGNIREEEDSVYRGMRIFNKPNSNGQNGYCFAPAIRLTWILRKLIEEAGMKASGSFFTDYYTRQLFLQSMNAMDGDVFAYEVDSGISITNAGESSVQAASLSNTQPVVVDGTECPAFTGINGVTVGFKTVVPRALLKRGITIGTSNNAELYDEIYALAIRADGAELPTLRLNSGATEDDGTMMFLYGKLPTKVELMERLGTQDETIFLARNIYGGMATLYWRAGSQHGNCSFISATESRLVQITASTSKESNFIGELGGYVEGSVRQYTGYGITTGVPLYVQLVKCRVNTSSTTMSATTTDGLGLSLEVTAFGQAEFLTNYEVQESIVLECTEKPLNIFSRVLKWSEHVPNMTAGEFLKAVCKTFGLTMYANPMTRELQLNFFKDIEQGTSFDITQWVAAKERLAYEPKHYKVSPSPTKAANDVAESNKLESVEDEGDLPVAATHVGKQAWIKNEGAYRKSVQVEETGVYRWEQSGGDDRLLSAGDTEGEKEEVTLEAKFPNMVIADEFTGSAKKVCEVDGQGCSQLLDENYNGEFDFIIQQYHGQRLFTTQGVNAVYIEAADPTHYRTSRHGAKLDLATVGGQSVGKKWLKPLYDFKGKHDSFRFVAYLPSWAAIRCMALLQPQNKTREERYIQVGSNRFLPIKVSYEFGRADTVVTTIECAAPHIS